MYKSGKEKKSYITIYIKMQTNVVVFWSNKLFALLQKTVPFHHKTKGDVTDLTPPGCPSSCVYILRHTSDILQTR